MSVIQLNEGALKMNEKIAEVVYQAIADAFMVDVDEIKNNPDKRLREDMGASSMQYFPIIATIEDECDIEVDMHLFQNEARTIGTAVDYVIGLYNQQHK